MTDQAIQSPLAIWPEPLSEQTIATRLPALLATALPAYLVEQRWYGEKSRLLRHATIQHVYAESRGDSWIALTFAILTYDDVGEDATYFIPVVIASSNEHRQSTIARIIDHADQNWTVADASSNQGFQRWIIESAAKQSVQVISSDAFCSWQSPHPETFSRSVVSTSRLLSGEQSNSNIAYGNESIVKVFRRVQPGLNPDIELGRYLTEDAGNQHVAPLLADWTLVTGQGASSSIGLAQRHVANVGDGWTWLLDRMRAAHNNPKVIEELESSINLLGQRTADVHCALARGMTSDLVPHKISSEQAQGWQMRADSLFVEIRERLSGIDVFQMDQTTQEFIQRFEREADSIRWELAEFKHLVGFAATRVHGDYHLGQTLHTPEGDWVLIDFEGEPARSLDERRSRSSPLKDVAGMIRSLAYARAFASTSEAPSWTDESRRLEQAFIDGYLSTISSVDQALALIPVEAAQFTRALRPWVIEKAIYEIAYELDNRPDWLWAPLRALFAESPTG
jgi:maltose alpha-D-glucosyltransferase / alpha-amylase